MDVRAKIRGILRNYGHDVYLQRKLGEQHQREVYKKSLERYTVRDMIPSSLGLARSDSSHIEGLSTDLDKVFWFEWDVNPCVGDLVYEANPCGNELGTDVYRIDESYPYRGIRGRVEYWACGCTRHSPESPGETEDLTA